MWRYFGLRIVGQSPTVDVENASEIDLLRMEIETLSKRFASDERGRGRRSDEVGVSTIDENILSDFSPLALASQGCGELEILRKQLTERLLRAKTRQEERIIEQEIRSIDIELKGRATENH